MVQARSGRPRLEQAALTGKQMKQRNKWGTLAKFTRKQQHTTQAGSLASSLHQDLNASFNSLFKKITLGTCKPFMVIIFLISWLVVKVSTMFILLYNSHVTNHHVTNHDIRHTRDTKRMANKEIFCRSQSCDCESLVGKEMWDCPGSCTTWKQTSLKWLNLNWAAVWIEGQTVNTPEENHLKWCCAVLGYMKNRVCDQCGYSEVSKGMEDMTGKPWANDDLTTVSWVITTLQCDEKPLKNVGQGHPRITHILKEAHRGYGESNVWRSAGEQKQGCEMRVSAYGISRGDQPLGTDKLLVEWEERKSGIPPLHLSSVKGEMENKCLCLRAFIFLYKQQYGNAREWQDCVSNAAWGREEGKAPCKNWKLPMLKQLSLIVPPSDLPVSTEQVFSDLSLLKFSF